MSSFDKKYLIYSILEFFEKEKCEDLNVAMQIISSKYGVSISNIELKLVNSLNAIFESGTVSLGLKLNNPLSFQDDEEYKKFIKMLKEKNYFEDFPEDSEMYRSRLYKANEAYLEKLQVRKKEAEEFKLKGNQLMKEKEFEKAIEMYKKAIELNPINCIYHSNMAASFTAMKKYTEAHESCDKSIKIDPTYVKAYLRKAIVFTHEKKFKDAVGMFEKAKEVDPDKSDEYDRKIKSVEKLIDQTSSQSSNPNPFAGGLPNLGNIQDMLSNPQFMQMANNMMQQPMFQNMMQNMMGGMGGQQGGGGGGGGQPNPYANIANNPLLNQNVPQEAIDELEQMPEVQNSEKLKKVVQNLKTEGMQAIIREMNDPDVKNLMQKLSQSAFQKMQGGGLGGNKKEDKDDDPPPGII